MKFESGLYEFRVSYTHNDGKLEVDIPYPRYEALNYNDIKTYVDNKKESLIEKGYLNPKVTYRFIEHRE